MMSNLELIDNPTVRALGAELMKLPYVIDVRFFPTLRDELKELAGNNAITFTAITKKGDGELRRHFVIVPEEVYLDSEKHHLIIEQMTAKINAFYEEGRSQGVVYLWWGTLRTLPKPRQQGWYSQDRMWYPYRDQQG